MDPALRLTPSQALRHPWLRRLVINPAPPEKTVTVKYLPISSYIQTEMVTKLFPETVSPYKPRMNIIHPEDNELFQRTTVPKLIT